MTRRPDDLVGRAIPCVELRSPAGLIAGFSAYGARLVSLIVPEASGRPAEVVMGPSTAADFAGFEPYAGSTCGRYANRIAGAGFMLDGRRVRLVPNEGANQLHGGPNGFSQRIWEVAEQDEASVAFALHSPDGDQGFPGALDARAEYRLADTTLACLIEARTNAPTVVNLTNHAYWNLAGHGWIADHTLTLVASCYTPVDRALIPTGEIVGVAGTPFDFRAGRIIGSGFQDLPDGYDHNVCLDGQRGALRCAASLADPRSGRRLDLFTTEAGLQVYTAAHFGPEIPGKAGPLQRFGAIALEPQTWPDAPNHPDFPSAGLRPGEVYRHRIEWRFGFE